MMKSGPTIWMLAVSICFVACGTGKSKDLEEGRIRPAAYGDGDTLELDPYPENLAFWMDYYRKKLPGFKNGAFHASGVVLHIDSMTTLKNKGSVENLPALFAWNPDSSKYIDLFGDRGWTVYPPLSALQQDGGDIDQEVVLGQLAPSGRKLVMFNGPGITVETADWLGKDAFILSRTTADEKMGRWTPELYLFSLKDSTFTNFTWSRTVPIDSVMGNGDEFLNEWLARRIKQK